MTTLEHFHTLLILKESENKEIAEQANKDFKKLCDEIGDEAIILLWKKVKDNDRQIRQ